MSVEFVALAIASVGAIAISAVSAGLVKKYDPNQILYWHLNRVGEVEGYEDARRESRVIISDKHNRYGTGIVSGILARGTLNEVKSKLKEYLQRERLVLRAKRPGEESIQTGVLDSRISRMKENDLSSEEQERFKRIYEQVLAESREVLHGLQHDPEVGNVAEYHSRVRQIIHDGIISGKTDNEIIIFCRKTQFSRY